MDPVRINDKQSRLGNCEVCDSENANYTCPRCEIKTCSLNCVNIHKKELDCNGDRDKVGFVPLSKFDNLTLLSDYRLLEDISRTIDNCRRNPLKKYTRYNRTLPTHLYRLRREALRRKTSLQYLPQHFTRHKDNTTIFHFDSGVIYWRLEIIFPHSENVKIVVEKCDENERLSTILSKYIDYDKCPDLYKKNLKFYHSKGLSGLEVLLKAENVKQQPSFFLLDISSTLRENFENRIIIEYPILYVIYQSHKDEFLILDPDMEVNCELDTKPKGKRRFPDFTPFTYFDTVTYSKKPTESDKAVDSIKSSVAQLRKYFAGDSDTETKDETDCKKLMKRETGVTNLKTGLEPQIIRKELNIPTYDNLIKQNS